MSGAATTVVALVARREFDARVRTRSFVVGLLVTVLLLVGIVVVPVLFGGDGQLMLAMTAVFTWLGGRIYANAVLRTGSRVTLRDALRSHS